MKNTFFAVSLIVSVLVFFSCNKEKITEYEKKIEALNSQISSLQDENSLLQEEIDKFKKTDEYFYQSGADAFLERHYTESIDWMNRLKVKFPTSSLIGYADKIINDSNSAVKKNDNFSPLEKSLRAGFVLAPGTKISNKEGKIWYIDSMKDGIVHLRDDEGNTKVEQWFTE